MVKYKESESESESAMHVAEPRFRVRVCMQHFYGQDDVRARAYVSVLPRRRVHWLQRRLRRLFALPRLRLLSRGHLLPPQESLALLQPDDPVECVPDCDPVLPRVIPVDAEPDDTEAAGDVVDSVDEVNVITVEEFQRSPSPVYLDDLSETKRQALLILDQYCTPLPGDRAAESKTRPRRRRVRRRRRIPASHGDNESTPRGDVEPAPHCRDEPAPHCCDEPAPQGDDEPALPNCDESAQHGDELAQAAVLREPDAFHEPVAVPLVLRNELQPRAPRVVHPLTDGAPAIVVDTPPPYMEIEMG